MRRLSLGVAAAIAVFSAITLGLWIPGDIESGVLETHRRRTVIGDAFAPTMVAAGLCAAALLYVISEIVKPGNVRVTLDRRSFRFVILISGVVCSGLLLMILVGPATVAFINAVGGDIGSYRELRDTFPYKFIGYTLGGTIMVGGVIAVVEGRLSKGAVLSGLLATLALAIFHDVPFEDLLLPPNGDQ